MGSGEEERKEDMVPSRAEKTGDLLQGRRDFSGKEDYGRIKDYEKETYRDPYVGSSGIPRRY